MEPDGLEFDADSLSAEPLHEGQDYEGVRVSLVTRLGSARIPLQIDIAFGQAVRPEATEETLPSLLDLPRATLLAYPPEVVVAEKFQAMTVLGMTNTRMKDFFDVAYMAKLFEFEAERLTQAMKATFERRQTAIPDEVPLALSRTYFDSVDRKRDWEGFRRRAGLKGDFETLASACNRIESFLMPVCAWIRQGSSPSLHWRSESGWGS